MKDVVLKFNQGAFRGALRAGFESVLEMAYSIQAEARQLSPVDTGRLKSSIMVEKDGDDSAIVGTDTPYAPHLEFGTKKMKAQPFMRPAADLAQLSDVKKITNKVMKEELKKGNIQVYKY